jgi:hypothetical protein
MCFDILRFLAIYVDSNGFECRPVKKRITKLQIGYGIETV